MTIMTKPGAEAKAAENRAAAQLHAALAAQNPQQALLLAPDLLAKHPESAELYHLLGVALASLGEIDDALSAYAVALHFAPDRADILSNNAISLRKAGRQVEALEMLDLAIARAPDMVNAHYNRANVLSDLRRLPEALASHDKALELDPGFAGSWNNRSVILFDLGLAEEALESAGRAIQLNPQDANAHYNSGLALRSLQRLDDANTAFRNAALLRPAFARAHVAKLFLDACMCDWTSRENELATVPTGLTGEPSDPFPLLALEDRPDHHLLRARRWVDDNWRTIGRASIPPRQSPGKLRIGYFSADFHDHATMHLMARMFALHDRSRFEIHGFCFGPETGDPLRQAAVGAMDRFHPVRTMDDGAVAALARAHGIDVAVDLKGHTNGARSGIFAHGAAPVQVAYLGYPGSTGAGFIDFLIADDTVITADNRQDFSERIVFLPDCYLATDNTRQLMQPAGDRAAHGLPDNGFVFCSFNNNYKISSAEFDSWMRLLHAVDGSVLWLLRDNPWAEANLRREAAQRGISPDRLVFADRVAAGDHLARQVLADLCLDSFNCNAHTTAVDCLWAGVPILTLPGRSFAARVAASLLKALEMPELIASDIADYEARAIALARSPEKLASLNARLVANRTTAALFDTERLTRHLEQGYLLMHETAMQGTPGDLRVTAIDKS